MRVTAVFLDVDGVLLDPVKTPAEWIRLVGDVLAPALGGEAQAWGRANAAAFPPLFADRSRWYDPDPAIAERRLITALLRDECRLVGMPYPGDDAAVALGRALDDHVCRHADCAFPATVDVIRELSGRYAVHTATGNPSWRVTSLLEQWRVRDRVGVPAGVDLVGVMKDSPSFYERVLARAGVRPEHAVVVDDAAEHLVRARALGTRTVLVDPGAGVTRDGADAVIANVADLPGVLRRLDDSTGSP